MCADCGCQLSAPAGRGLLSKVELIKSRSLGLRGSLAQEVALDTPAFSEEAVQILKFHGVYQQDDRDLRKEARSRGLEKHHQMMIRTRIPGGVLSAESYLAHDGIAERWGNATLRVTTRQDFQLHGVLKGDLRASLRAINAALLSTLGGCGDQARNIMCCPAPERDRLGREVAEVLSGLAVGLLPATSAYHEIWIDGELIKTARREPEPEPLYGSSYLPRKFKTAVALEGDNCVDVYSNDLGLVARRDASGGLAGFDVLVGGGLGRTHNKPDTFAAVAQSLGFIPPSGALELTQAVIRVHRDHGDRSDRRHARLKYLIHRRGLSWFKARVEEQLTFPLGPSRALPWEPVDDHLGWHEEGDGAWFLGLFVENGRICDVPGHALRTALAEIVARFRPQIRLTAQQNLILAHLGAQDRRQVDGILRAHGVGSAMDLPSALRHSMACPAWPTCGLAVAESERVLPELIRGLAGMLDELGLSQVRISFRMTGCPNGCARPYLGDVGFVGTTLGKYDVFLGGDFEGTRLNQIYAHNVPLEDIPELLRGPLLAFSHERVHDQGFGDWCHQVGLERLRSRCGAGAV